MKLTTNTSNPKIAKHEDVKVYPNPFSTYIQIEAKGKIMVKVYDLKGRVQVDLLLEGKSQIATDSLARGMYIVMITSEEGIISQHKLLK